MSSETRFPPLIRRIGIAGALSIISTALVAASPLGLSAQARPAAAIRDRQPAWAGAVPEPPTPRICQPFYVGPGHILARANALGVSPTGSTVFVAGGTPSRTSGCDFGTVAYDARTGAQLWMARYNGPGNGDDHVNALAVSPDGSEVFVTGDSTAVNATYDYATIAYDAATGKQLWAARYDGPGKADDEPRAIAVSPDGSTVFVTGYTTTSDGYYFDYATVAYGASSGRRLWVRRYNGREDEFDLATALGVSPDGSTVFVTGRSQAPDTDYDFATVAYDAATGAKVWVARYNGPKNDYDGADALGVSPDGSTVLVTGASTGLNYADDYATVAYDASTGQQRWVARYDGPTADSDKPAALGVSPDGSTVFVTGGSVGSGGSIDYATVSYDASSGTQRWVSRYNGPPGGDDTATALGVSPDGSRVFVTGGSNGSDNIYNFDYATLAYDSVTGDGLWLRRYQGLQDNDVVANALGVSPDGSRVFVTGSGRGWTASLDYATIAYRAPSGREIWIER